MDLSEFLADIDWTRDSDEGWLEEGDKDDLS